MVVIRFCWIFRSKTNWSHGKGKGQGQQSQSEVKCFRCNEQGHYAKDCTARTVAEDGGQVHEAPQASSSRTLVFDMRGGGLDRIDESTTPLVMRRAVMKGKYVLSLRSWTQKSWKRRFLQQQSSWIQAPTPQ